MMPSSCALLLVFWHFVFEGWRLVIWIQWNVLKFYSREYKGVRDRVPFCTLYSKENQQKTQWVIGNSFLQGPSNIKVFLSRNYEINWSRGVSDRNWGSFTLWFKSRPMLVLPRKDPPRGISSFSIPPFLCFQQARWSASVLSSFCWITHWYLNGQRLSILPPCNSANILGSVQGWHWLELMPTAKVYNCISPPLFLPSPWLCFSCVATHLLW